VLYQDVLRIRPREPEWEERDRFVLSKGHCCAVLYAALAELGFFPVSDLEGYAQSGSALMGHASHKVPGVEWSTGSLGHGLGLACGQALAAGRRGAAWRVYAVLSDGELDEGSNWEAILFAAHHGLGNLTVVVDANRQQALGATREVLNTEPLVDKFIAFGWDAEERDGHDLPGLRAALTEDGPAVGPRAIIARTVKGKGVAYMEDRLEWHYRAPKTDELLERALRELDQAYGR
jgi:transketolase